MPRIPYPDPATLSEEARKMIAGTPINIVRMAAHAAPGFMAGQATMSYTLADPATIDPQLREVLVLRVGQLSNSDYELSQHRRIAANVGLQSEQIEAIIAGDYSGLSPLWAAAARFADDVVRNVSPSDETLAEMRRHVDDSLLVNMTLIVGHFMGLARLIAVTGPDLDEVTLGSLPTSMTDRFEKE